MALAVVVAQPLRKIPVNDSRILRKRIEQLFLDRAFESLDMGVVIGLADARVAMGPSRLRDEPLSELRPMIALEHAEAE